MASHPLTEAALRGLRESLTGEAVTPDDAGYDEARSVFNAMIDRRPAVIVLCESAGDVAAAIRFAREHELELAVRGGGHSVAGLAATDGGLVVDLRRMHAVTVDPDARTARVGGGATMSHLDRATQPYDLATTGGRASTTGVGGFTLGGGSGWLERKFGLACDNLLAVDLVTADGTEVHASDDEHPELFWALHGGGGNFGAATSMTLKLHPLPDMSVAFLFFPAARGAEVLPVYREVLGSAPDEVGGGFVYLTGPPEDFMPEHLVGRAVCLVLITYAGTEPALRAATKPLFGLGHEAEVVTELPYADLQCMIDDPPGLRNYWSAEYLRGLPDEAVDVFCARANSMIVPSNSQHILFPMGGAMARGDSRYPLPWRTAEWVAHPFGIWDSPADDARGRQWVRDARTDVMPWSIGQVYLNFIGDEGEERVVAGFGAENHRRLADVKARYDPDNVFRLNHNIKPS
ncbi:FAD-binding oxidoreductase [Streptomyces sp. NBC_01619]|uniref:FAD-binding oxidoreductase n=1 Tax=Streptomyces pratisoli TaxID=3139917 RepID=A0ACC6QCX5_9ACTN|nr:MULTISPECIES: FAD-binding oxidoreductase [unclassified Streptomyces]MCX4509925.1 FAD-binding oxidoreductase [Streptomyces sp. NBC_01619]